MDSRNIGIILSLLVLIIMYSITLVQPKEDKLLGEDEYCIITQNNGGNKNAN